MEIQKQNTVTGINLRKVFNFVKEAAPVFDETRNKGAIGVAKWVTDGGAQPVNHETVTIGDVIFEFYTVGSTVTTGHIALLIGVDLAHTTATLAAAIIAHCKGPFFMSEGTATIVWLITADKPGVLSTTHALATPLPTLSTGGAGKKGTWVILTPGQAEGGKWSLFSVDLTTANIAAPIDLGVPFLAAGGIFILMTSAGAIKPSTCTLTFNNGTATFTSTGNTPAANTDTALFFIVGE